MEEFRCWNCGESLVEIPLPISRHENCPKCFTELHCCRLCGHYDSKLPDQCDEDAAEPPVNKEFGNFCEWFTPATAAYEFTRTQKSDVSVAKLDSLFAISDLDEKKEQPNSTSESTSEVQDDARNKLDSLFSKD